MLIVNSVLSDALVCRAQQEAYPSFRVKKSIHATIIQMAARRYFFNMKVKRRMAYTAELRCVQAAVQQYLLAKQNDDDDDGDGDVSCGTSSFIVTSLYDDNDDDDHDDGDDGLSVGSEEYYDNPEEDDVDHCDTCACVEGWLGGIINFFSGMLGHRNLGNAMDPPPTPPPHPVIDGGYVSSSSPPVLKRQRISPTAAHAPRRRIAFGGDLTSSPARVSTSPPAPARTRGDLASPPPARAAAAAGENQTPSQQNQRRGGVTHQDDISSMRIKHLKEELESYGISTDSFLDKESLVDAVRTARIDASSTSTLPSGRPKDEEVPRSVGVGKPKDDEGDVDGHDLWNRFRSNGYNYKNQEWKDRQFPDAMAQWYEDQTEYKECKTKLARGSEPVPGSTSSPFGMKAAVAVDLGHFDPCERREDTKARGVLRLNDKKEGFKEQCWDAVRKFKQRLIIKVFEIPEEKEDDLRNLIISTTAVSNRLIGDHPHNWHSSGQNQNEYDRERRSTDPLVMDMLQRLMPLLAKDAVVLPYGKNNTSGDTSVYKLLPPKYFVSREQIPHMLLIRMGWLTPPLRLSLIKAIIQWAGRLLNYSQDKIDAKLSPSFLTPDFLDGIVKCRSPRKSNGKTYKKGDLVTTIEGKIIRLDFDPETIDEFNAYVDQWKKEKFQRMLHGANISIQGAIAQGREASIGFFRCTKCSKEPQLRAFGAECACGGRWEVILNANGERMVAVVPGYCDNCNQRGQLKHKHKCTRDGETEVRVLQRMQPSLNYSPSDGVKRNVMVVVFDSEGVMETTWAGGPGRGLSNLATELIPIAERLLREEGITALPPWMVSSYRSVRVAASFRQRMRDVIIGKDGIENGSFELDGKIYSGVPIELPDGHAGDGRLPAPKFYKGVWNEALYAQYFQGN